jgi:hypothetical protein
MPVSSALCDKVERVLLFGYKTPGMRFKLWTADKRIKQ